MIITGKAAFDGGAGDAHRVRRGDGRHRHGAGRRPAPDRAAAGPGRPIADARHPRCHRAAAARTRELVQTAQDVPLIVVVGPEAPRERRGRARRGRRQGRRGRGRAGRRRPRGRRSKRSPRRASPACFAEGGAEVASSLVSGDLVDEVVIFRAPVVVGPDGVRALGGMALSAIERSPRYRLVETAIVGEDTMRRYVRACRSMFTGIVTDVGRVVRHRRAQRRAATVDRLPPMTRRRSTSARRSPAPASA